MKNKHYVDIGRFCIRTSLYCGGWRWDLNWDKDWPALYLGKIVIEWRPKGV